MLLDRSVGGPLCLIYQFSSGVSWAKEQSLIIIKNTIILDKKLVFHMLFVMVHL